MSDTAPDVVETEAPKTKVKAAKAAKAKADDNRTHIVYTDKNGDTQRIPRDEYHAREAEGTL